MASLPLPPKIDKLNSKEVRAYLDSVRNNINATTGQNIGSGVSVYAGKTGDNLQFRQLRSTNTRLSVALNDTSDTIDLTIPTTSSSDVYYTASTYSRNLHAKLSDFPSVKDYGALGDGTTDDTAAINAAIAANLTVYFPEGVYRVIDRIRITNSGQRIYGAGTENTFILSESTVATIEVDNNLTGWEIYDLTLDRPAAYRPATSGMNGIYVAGTCNLVKIENVEVYHHYDGFSLGPTGYSYIHNCLADSNYRHGFNISHAVTTGGFQWSIYKSLAELNDGYGFVFQTSSSGSGSTSCGDLINISTYANKLGGLWYLGTTQWPINAIRIRGGFFGEDGNHELYLDTYGSSSHQISDVFTELAGNSACGVASGTAATHVGSGFKITANNTDVNLSGCVAILNYYNGFETSAGRSIFTSCESRLNGVSASAGNTYGFKLSAGLNTVTGCASRGNTTYGIYCGVDSNVIVGNDLRENTTGAISVASTLVSSQVVGNLPETMGQIQGLTYIADTNNNELLTFGSAASATNNVKISNSNAANPQIEAVGDSASISINFQAKGSAGYNLLGTANTPAFFRVFEQTTNGSNYVAVISPAALSADYTVTLPAATGTLALNDPVWGGTGLTSYTKGDIIYSSATNVLSKLSGNTTTTKKWFNQTGDGTNSAAPAWTAIVAADISNAGTGVSTWLVTPSSANLAAAITDETGSGSLVFGTSPTLTTPNIVGTSTNNNASAGSVGEVIESTVLTASAVSMTSGATTNITSISLTAGDWDVWGNIWFKPAAGTIMSYTASAITTTSATFPTPPNGGASNTLRLTFPASVEQGFPVGMMRLSLSATTTVYLIGYVEFTVSTQKAYGYLGARRIR
jgi:hypothetical protein